MDAYWIALVIGIAALVTGLLMMWRRWENGEFVLGIGLVLTLLSLFVIVVSPALFGVPEDRLEVRVFNQMRDPLHVVIVVNGTEVSNTNLDPPQWFNGDNNRHLFLHPNDIGREDGAITVSINNQTATALPGLWGLGDAITIIINADGTITLKDDNLNNEGK